MSGAGRPNEQQPPPPPFPTGLAPPTQPPLALPQRSSVDTLFASSSSSGSSGGMFDMGLGLGFSPGPMTMASRFFSDNGEECKSFSQLLTGAMASPTSSWLGFMNAGSAEKQLNDGGLQFKQTRPDGMALPPPSPMMFAVSPGLSPAALLDSPGIFPVTPGHSGAMRQQGLVIHAVAQASQAHPSHHSQAGYAPSSSAASSAEIMAQIPLSTTTTTMHQLTSSHLEESKAAAAELPDLSCLDHRSLAAAFAVDKPADDGYNWRKYGQKQVKGSEFPRSYYKCTQPSCPVKKKVERSLDGHITEIIYKGQHNHQPPKNNKRTRDSGMACGSSDIDENSQAPLASMSKGRESSQVNPGNLSGTSDSEEVGDAETGAEDRDEDEPSPKRRSTEVTVLEAGCSHRTVTEPKIIVQTTSEVDLLDDGYRWRKYGQKVVKGNPHPRSYYKCTTPGCNVRKHIERASSDPKAVITTYEGKHNHDVPAAKPSSHTIASNYASRSSQQQHVETQKHELTNSITFSLGTTSQQPVAPQQLKQEQTT